MKFRKWLLPILGVTMGMQLLRVFIPSLAWYLRDTAGLSSLSLAPYAFLTFLAGFLAAPLRRFVGSTSALRITVIGVACMRLLEQLSTNPEVDLWLSIVGMTAFLMFLPIYLGHLRGSSAPRLGPEAPDLGPEAPRPGPEAPGLGANRPVARLWGYGIVLGMAVDIALRGASGTLDLSWIAGPIPIIVSVALSALLIWAAWGESEPDSDSETSWSAALPLAAIGPFILLQVLIYQSHGWVEEVTGIGQPYGFFVVMLGNVFLVLGARWGFSRSYKGRSALALITGVYLALITYTASSSGLLFVLTLFVAQFLMGWGWSLISVRTAPATRSGLARSGIALPLGMLLFLAFAFAYYLALDLALPFSRSLVIPAAALLLGGLVWIASRGAEPTPLPDRSGPLWAAALLALVPWILWFIQGPPPEPGPVSGLPVRIMTFNIHSGFGSAGRQDPEAIARVIENSGADIVALQEVSRVRLMDGGTDLATWLSRRLDMPYVFKGTEEPIWGNAILSRFPVISWGSADLPREGALIGRGFVWVEIDLGFPLLVIDAHLHHIEDDNHIRLKEVPVLLDFWAQRPTTVLLGDLNAEPHFPEMALPAEAGLVDSWSEVASGNGFTWSADDPHKRIDWIWHTSDLMATEVEVVQSLSSDHLPVIAEIELAP